MCVKPLTLRLKMFKKMQENFSMGYGFLTWVEAAHALNTFWAVAAAHDPARGGR
jgi:hypothetical protein